MLENKKIHNSIWLDKITSDEEYKGRPIKVPSHPIKIENQWIYIFLHFKFQLNSSELTKL